MCWLVCLGVFAPVGLAAVELNFSAVCRLRGVPKMEMSLVTTTVCALSTGYASSFEFMIF